MIKKIKPLKILKKLTPKSIALISSLFLVILISSSVFFTLAYNADVTDEIVNKFAIKDVVINIQENFDGAQKSNVAVKNTGELPAYIRFKISVSAIDKDGNVVILPINIINTSTTVADLICREIDITDFTITESNWQDKFYYDSKSEIYYCKTLVPVESVIDVFSKATFNLKIFDESVADLPLPLVNENSEPYYVFDQAGELHYKLDKEGNPKVYTKQQMTNKNFTSVLDDKGTFTYMLETYTPVLTITAESVEGNGVVDAWNVILNENGEITGVDNSSNTTT